MQILRVGITHPNVERWQQFLIGQGYNPGPADAIYGRKTKEATIKFQRNNRLKADGIVGKNTRTVAEKKGFVSYEKDHEKEVFLPDRPDFHCLHTNAQREELFGSFDFKHTPTDRNPEKIEILGDWEEKNIVMVELPELAKATDGKYTRMRFHRLGENQLRGLWFAWDQAGLLDRVLSYEGAFYPRYVRGSRSTLSNHSFGTAFDINAKWNHLGKVPAKQDQKGSVVEVVSLANEWGFFWGGHFARMDGMHFELAKLINEKGEF